MAASPDVLVPASAEEAASLFGDGAGVTVFAGGTILMPELTAGRLSPVRTLLLGRAGLDTVATDGAVTRIGAAVSVAALTDSPARALAAAAANVGDAEIRAQGTVGGNVCAPPGAEVPRGDLQAPLADAPRRDPAGAGRNGERMNLTVNGVEHEIDSPPLTPLLHVLRDELEITSPKAGCQQGGCGTCTVLVDGEPRRSCLTAVAAVDGAAITTLEGLGEPEQLSPVQAAFHAHYAAQCGFCTPGMVAAPTALLGRKGGPLERNEVIEGLSGHY